MGGLYNRYMLYQAIPPFAGDPIPRKRFRFPHFLGVSFVLLLGACQTGRTGTASDGLEGATQEAMIVPAASSRIPSPGINAESGIVSTETPVEPSATDAGFPAATQPAFGSCSDNLTFMGDLTYPDRTPVLTGQPLEKRWKVRNSGLCDWGPEYRFRWVGGAVLSSQQEFALFPAVAGSEAVITVLLTAPLAPGEYISSWRAFSPLGAAFGDTLYIDVVVSA